VVTTAETKLNAERITCTHIELCSHRKTLGVPLTPKCARTSNSHGRSDRAHTKENDVSDIPKTALGFRESDGIDTSGFEKPSTEDYNRNTGRLPNAPLSGGTRESSKSATYPWSADTSVNASKVKSSDANPID
jgi:hypothetical protein